VYSNAHKIIIQIKANMFVVIHVNMKYNKLKHIVLVIVVKDIT